MYKNNSRNMQGRAERITMKDIPSGIPTTDLLDVGAQRRVLIQRMEKLKAQISEQRTRFSFHGSRSLIDQIKRRYQRKPIPEGAKQLLAMAEEYQLLTDEVIRLNQKKATDRWRGFFFTAAERILTPEEFQNVRQMAERLCAEHEAQKQLDAEQPKNPAQPAV